MERIDGGGADPDEPDDAALIERSLSDPAAFGAVYDRHAGVLARYLIRRVGADDGEALLGDLFRIAFERRARYQMDRRDARPWLYGIAANLVMKQHRGSARRWRAVERLAARPDARPSLADDVAGAVDAERSWKHVAQAIDELAPGDREVLLLFAWEQLSYAEIAEALSIPVGTVRSRLNRVRRTLREPGAAAREVPDMPTLGAGGQP